MHAVRLECYVAIMSMNAAMSLLVLSVLATTVFAVSGEALVPRGRSLLQEAAPDTADVVYQLVSLLRHSTRACIACSLCLGRSSCSDRARWAVQSRDDARPPHELVFERDPSCCRASM